MKAPDVINELKIRGLSTKGKKSELVSRMKDAIENNLPILENITKSKAQNMAGVEFTPGAHWEELACDGDFIEEQISSNRTNW